MIGNALGYNGPEAKGRWSRLSADSSGNGVRGLAMGEAVVTPEEEAATQM